MCGICGIVALGRPAETETARRMGELIAHRGPDGSGDYSAPGVALHHRRLAIIDLTDGGLQPFASDDGSLQLLHNGEIYNYRELRKELEGLGHRFRSATDTEVVLAAYREWGERCVERFNGMWALALWDEKTQRLFCSRDRFGVKPFYYRYHEGRFAFASELKAFAADPETPLRPNERIVRDYILRDWFDHTDETFFEGIVKLPPAHSLIVDADGLRLQRYWELQPREAPPGDPAPLVRELFFDSVRLRLRSDVPVGTCLSGGIDSSAVAGVVDVLLRTEVENARPVGERQQMFTVYFDEPGFDERPFAEAVVARTKAAPHWISFEPDDLVASLPAIVESQDEPFRSTSICAQWYVMREAAHSGIKVVLDGQGGDEVFAGYPAFFAAYYGDLLARGRLRTLGSELATHRRLYGSRRAAEMLTRPLIPRRLEPRLRASLSGAGPLLGRGLQGLPETCEPDGALFRDRLRRLQTRILTTRGLPELLHAEDRNSMAHSIEARVPFLDYRLVELLFSLDARQKIDRSRTKSVLRRALADVLPQSVSERTDKLGFVTPEARWMRGALGDLAARVFASETFRARGWIDPVAAERRLAEHRAGLLDAGFELWRAVNVELWARRFVDP